MTQTLRTHLHILEKQQLTDKVEEQANDQAEGELPGAEWRWNFPSTVISYTSMWFTLTWLILLAESYF